MRRNRSSRSSSARPCYKPAAGFHGRAALTTHFCAAASSKCSEEIVEPRRGRRVSSLVWQPEQHFKCLAIFESSTRIGALKQLSLRELLRFLTLRAVFD